MDRFFTDAANKRRVQTTADAAQEGVEVPEQYPKGVVLDKDDKPWASKP